MGGLRVRLERGQAALGAGRCLVALGRHREAAARLDEARRTFEPSGPLADADRSWRDARSPIVAH